MKLRICAAMFPKRVGVPKIKASASGKKPLVAKPAVTGRLLPAGNH